MFGGIDSLMDRFCVAPFAVYLGGWRWLSMFQFHVLAIRSSTESFFRQGLWSNYRLTGAVLLGTAMQLAVIYVPPLQPVFHTVGLTLSDLAITWAVASSVFFSIELWKFSRRRASRQRERQEH